MSDLPNEEQMTPTEGRGDPPIKPKNTKSVAIYLVILFAAAFALLLMAYFMQQRSNNEVIGNLQNSVNQFQTVDELRAENQKLQERLEEYEALIEELVSQGLLIRGEDGSLEPIRVYHIDRDDLQDIITGSGIGLYDLIPDPTPSP